MGRVLMVVIPLAITIYAVVDAIQTEDANVKHLPKLVWVLLILVFTPIGAIAWFFAGRQRGPSTGHGGRKYPTAPRGPDDDPDFLRNL